jgi:hypothetical protein
MIIFTPTSFMNMETALANIQTAVFNNDIEGVRRQVERLQTAVNSGKQMDATPDGGDIPDFTDEILKSKFGFITSDIKMIDITGSPAKVLLKAGQTVVIPSLRDIYLDYIKSLGISLDKVIFKQGDIRFFYYYDSKGNLIQKKLGDH